MTTWQAMAALEGLGYRFEITAEGKIRGTIEGTKPPEASALLEIVRRDRDSAAAYVKERLAGSTVVDSTCNVFDAVAIGETIRNGAAQLFGQVVYHRQADSVTIRWEPLNGQAAAALLDTRREALRNALQSRLCTMEVLPERELSGDEIDALNREYGRCMRLLEGFTHGF